MMPLVDSPKRLVMHEAMNPIMSTICNDEIADHAQHERQRQYRIGKMRTKIDPMIDLTCGRKHHKLIHKKYGQVVRKDLAIGHRPGRSPDFNRRNTDDPYEKQQGGKQVVLQNIRTELTAQKIGHELFHVSDST
jgi:hypothetical protein